MYVLITDRQAVPSSDSQIFSMVQQSPISAGVTLNNDGGSIIGYHFQQFSSGTWADISALPSPLNNTLSPGQTVTVQVASSFPQVRLMANGNSSLQFAVQRFVDRPSGAIIPLLTL